MYPNQSTQSTPSVPYASTSPLGSYSTAEFAETNKLTYSEMMQVVNGGNINTTHKVYDAWMDHREAKQMEYQTKKVEAFHQFEQTGDPNLITPFFKSINGKVLKQ